VKKIWLLLVLTNPRDVVPVSIMPTYGFMLKNTIDGKYIADVLRANRMVGVPYTDEMIKLAQQDFIAQADSESDSEGLLKRYPKAQVRNFDGQPQLTEMDALIAYLQVLGTMVDFSTFEPLPSR